MRRLSRIRVVLVGALALGGVEAWAAPPAAQLDPVILHSAVECWPQTEFLVLRAAFQPGVEIVTAKAYFRSNMYPDFYYVEVTVQPTGEGEAVMPKPGPETTAVIYYLEAVTRTFASARSTEWTAAVADPDSCKRRNPAVAWFDGDRPKIVVGATRLGAAAIPPGFSASGISGFINASGASAAGGGIGTGAAIGAIAGAAAGLAVLGASATSSGDATTTTVALAPAATSTPTTTTTIAGSPGAAPFACFTTDPNPPVILENQAVRFDASCSRGDTLQTDAVVNYRWDFGNGKIVEGPDRRVVNTLYESRGTYTVELIVQDEAGNRSSTTRAVIVEAPPTTTTTISPMADLSVTKTGAPDPVATGAALTYDVVVTNNGPVGATVVVLTDTLPDSVQFRSSKVSQGSCMASGFTVTCTLGSLASGARASVSLVAVPLKPGPITNVAVVSAAEIDPNSSNNRAEVKVTVVVGLRAAEAELDASFRSDLERAGARGRVELNGASLELVDGKASAQHRFKGPAGVNVVEAFLEPGEEGGALWRFDFSGDPHFVPGSLEVDSGDVLSLDARSVVFAARGGSAERIRFRFTLQP